MDKVFRVYASQGGDNYVELDLPASDYEMLDLMERLRLEPGKPPYVEILEYLETFDYLERCLPGQPNIYQLNVLARKLSEFSGTQDMAAFEGLVGMEMQKGSVSIELTRLIDFAHSTDRCVIAESAMTDFQLGKFLVENEFIEEANGLSDSALALLDYGKIGREHREEGGGVYTGFGYVEQASEIYCVSKAIDFQPRKPDYTILVNMEAIPLMITPGRQEDMVQLRLPASEEQMRAALEKLGRRDWNDIILSVCDSPIPCLKDMMCSHGEVLQLLELAECLQILDAAGEMPKYKAILETEECQNVSLMLSLAGIVDKYLFNPQVSSPADVAWEKLKVLIGDEDAKTFMPYIDLQRCGRVLMERDHAVITEYGMVEWAGREQMQDMEEQPGPGGMEMM